MSKPELNAADEHLASCGECREMLASREDLSAQIDSLQVDLDKSADEEHVDYAQLEAYVDQKLDALERQALDVHFQACKSCSEELRDLQAFKDQLAEREVLVAAVSSSSAERRPRKIPFFGFPGAWRTGSRWALAACAVIALVVGIRLLWLWQQKPATIVHKPETAPAPIPQPTKPPDATQTSFSYLPAELQAIVANTIETQHIQTPRALTDLDVRRGEDQGSFRLLAPVGTVVSSATPVFRWRAVPNADGYRVQLSDVRRKPVESSPTVTDTSWKPAVGLRRGTTYIWRIVIIVRGEEVEESPLDVPQAYFNVLDEAQSQQLQELQHAHPNEHFARGVLLGHAGVLEEAAQEFRAVPPSDPNYELAQKLNQQLRLLIAKQSADAAQ